jgi:hypothetical protein
VKTPDEKKPAGWVRRLGLLERPHLRLPVPGDLPVLRVAVCTAGFTRKLLLLPRSIDLVVAEE